jgi:hypothetical protein
VLLSFTSQEAMVRKALIILLVLSAQIAVAQKNDRVLVVGRFSDDIDSMKRWVEAAYRGAIDTSRALPSELSKYDAIFIKASAPVEIGDQRLLVDYLESGGNLMLNSTPGSGRDEAQVLWHRVRDTGMYLFATEAYSQVMVGFDQHYTKGFNYPLPVPHQPLQPDLGGLMRARGLLPVLQLETSISPSECAWISPDSRLRFVFWLEEGKYSPQQFISLTVCNYFQLCLADVQDEQESERELSFDPLTSTLDVPETGVLEVYDIVGVMVFSREVEPGAFTLRDKLWTGSYIVTLRTAQGRSNVRVVVTP